MWNIIEALLAVIAGGFAGSASLISFGLSSLAELATGFVALHELRHGTKYWMHRALSSFFAMVAAAAVAGGLLALVRGPVDGPGIFSIVVAAISLLMMSAIGGLQRRAGLALSSPALVAHAKMSFLDAGLAGAVLVGLLLWAGLGIWWADAAAALIVAALAARESYDVAPRRVDKD